MISFENDYSEGTHESILEKIVKTNMEQTDTYSTDVYCEKAREIIKKECDAEGTDVHFMVGGTISNLTVISSILRPHQGVISSDIGHINVHESGAIEATGHKVLTLKNENGKITGEQVKQCLEDHYNDPTYEHMVQPGMVYISNPTEIGTLYSKAELSEISKVCREYNIPLFLDGARMAYGLTSEVNDLTLSDISKLCDVFYIGGNKCGALFGEAIVIVNEKLKKDFRYIIKQKGGLLEKSRLLGIQFETLFENGLYYKLGKHANEMAKRIKEACIKYNFPLYAESYTNQQFIIFLNKVLNELNKKYKFAFWEKVDESHTAVRVCTSWATKSENVDMLIRDLEKLSV